MMDVDVPAGAVWAMVTALQLGAGAVVLIQQRCRTTVLAKAASTDELTALLNRRGLSASYTVMARRQQPAVLLLDLRRFKHINDRFGYHTGDDILREVAARPDPIAKRHGGVAGRLGGDEFALLLPGAAESTVSGTIREIERTLAAPVQLTDAPESVTLGTVIGASLPFAATADGPFRPAVIALHHARHRGLSSAIYRPGMRYPAAENRHGPRLRDRPAAPPLVGVDMDHLHWLTAGPQSGSAVDPDPRVKQHVDVLDPRSRLFGAKASALVAVCLAHKVLQLHDPVTGLQVEPTSDGQQLVS